MTTDPWRGIQKGDRYYHAAWNAQTDSELWYEVTDLWFDPVRGQHDVRHGYMVAIRLLGRGNKRALTAATLAGKRYRSVRDAETAALAVLKWAEREET